MTAHETTRTEYPFELTDTEQMVQDLGSYEAAFDQLAVCIVQKAVESKYVPDVEDCRDVANLLMNISKKADEADDHILNGLVGKAAELWNDRRTHTTFSFEVEVIKRDGQYRIWRPQ